MSRTRVQETMKSALMRGICALNVVTMPVLQPELLHEAAPPNLMEDKIASIDEYGIGSDFHSFRWSSNTIISVNSSPFPS